MTPRSSAPDLRLSNASSARVLRTIRFRGPVSRPEVAASTGLSVATVGRATSALLAAGVIRERPELMHDGSVGRPSIPVELDPSGPMAVAIHIGLSRSVVAICDLGCRILSEYAIPTPGSDPEQIADELSAIAFRLLDGHRGRRLVWGGVATAARITTPGRIDHDLLGWQDVPVADLFADRIGVPFSVAPHVEAMAAAELLLGHESHRGTTLVVYAREHLGSALVIDGAVHLPRAGSAELAHLPVGPTTHLDDKGAGLLDVVGDSGLVRAAAAHGISVDSVSELAARAHRDPMAEAILVERATILGRLVGLVSAITRPDSVVLCGQAFTDHPRYLTPLIRATRQTPLAGGAPDLRVSTAGGRIQQFAAMAVALDAISADPTSVLPTTLSSAS
ncbi:ROK family protein [Rhodococcus sp. IEGM 1408]|uniref:ROK family transcriptional regulator n=1 Tax=Rhodococcus sp. IEGM 1408 TaxID=3082220 RepID=UPI0029532B70|nr:ROK family protein [Rhodococcus sp. IEGM 1408]MDV8002332.1 ROK family protein [Rhodococcus sp. IEGM 1408]